MISSNLTTPNPTSPNPTSNSRTFLCLATALFLASLGNNIANIALPALARAFGAPVQSTTQVVSAYLATLTLFSLAAGLLGDRFGRRATLIVGLVIFTVASAGAGLAPSLPALIAARALQGIGAAILMVLSLAMVRDTTPPPRVGRAMGVLGSVSAVGTALGPVLGGALIGPFGWSAVFLVLVPGGVVAFVLALWALPSTAPRPLPQTAPRPLPQTAPRPLPQTNLCPDLQPAARPRLLSRLLAPLNSTTAVRFTANFIVAMVMMTTLIIGPFFLGLALGLRDAQVGLVMAVGPVLSILSGVPSGRMVDALGPQRVVLIGLLALITGALSLALLGPAFGVIGYIAAIAVLTPGYQLFQAANNTATLSHAPADQRATASGLLALSRNLGLFAGATVMGVVFAFGTGTDALETATPMAIANGMRLTFVAAAVLLLLALALMVPHRHRTPH
ncbi:MFS transporter [Rhodobacteraceae bacterium D3-12]|nr:MFS transporter [Rhodobacteraceae bacterium D3-12]